MFVRRNPLIVVIGLAVTTVQLTRAAKPAIEPGPAESAAGAKEGMLSSRLAAEVRARLPVFSPPAAKVGAEPETPEGVIMMPQMIVREPKLPPPDSRDWLTPKGYAEYLRRKYPGAILGGAAMLDAEDRRLEQLNGLTGLADTIGAATGEHKVDDLRAEIRRAFARRPDPMTDAKDKWYNNGRR